MSSTQRPVILCIMDGWGDAPAGAHNAVSQAQTPHVDRLMAEGPLSFLDASGPAVGLPDGQPGNSEVGHMTIGSGRLIQQDLPRINDAIAAGTLKELDEMQEFIGKMRASGGAVHMLGLLSTGGVHAHSRHIQACANIFAEAGLPVHIHMFSDGRDTIPKIAEKMLEDFRKDLAASVQISSLSGRYFAMDRDKRWERTEIVRNLILSGHADYEAVSIDAGIEAAYARGETDEFISPTIVAGYDGLKAGDGLFMANFRVDRARQIMSAFITAELTDLTETTIPPLAASLAMTPLSDWLDPHVPHLFGPPDLSQGLGQCVSEAGFKQLRLAETEKYPHVTFFFNGGAETPFHGEDRAVIASPKVATYDMQPEMSAEQVLTRALEAVNAQDVSLIIINFANPDRVGHTGDIGAAIQAVEMVDKAVGALCAAVTQKNGVMIVTADHGNCEVMWDNDNACPHTAHTTNLVPCMLVGAEMGASLSDGTLADLAPTLLHLLDVPIPEVMTGKSLIRKR